MYYKVIMNVLLNLCKYFYSQRIKKELQLYSKLTFFVTTSIKHKFYNIYWFCQSCVQQLHNSWYFNLIWIAVCLLIVFKHYLLFLWYFKIILIVYLILRFLTWEHNFTKSVLEICDMQIYLYIVILDWNRSNLISHSCND